MKENFYYTPTRNIDNNILILDEDPKKAAKALIKAHVVFYLPVIQNIFIKYHNKCANKHSHAYMWISYMKRSRQNFLWVVQFYEALQDIFKKHISADSNYYSHPNIEFYDKYLKLDTSLPNGRNEICLPAMYRNRHLNDKKRFKEFKETFINSNRIKYIINNYSENMFVNKSIPEWYNKVKGTFELINVIDNNIVRMVRNEQGNYRYYCKVGLSDSWDEIKNVPWQMRFVINALMYTSEGPSKSIVEKRLRETIYKMDKILSGDYEEIQLEGENNE